MTDFWIVLLIGLPFTGGLLGWRLARADRRIMRLNHRVLRDIDIDREAERGDDEEDPDRA